MFAMGDDDLGGEDRSTSLLAIKVCLYDFFAFFWESLLCYKGSKARFVCECAKIDYFCIITNRSGAFPIIQTWGRNIVSWVFSSWKRGFKNRGRSTQQHGEPSMESYPYRYLDSDQQFCSGWWWEPGSWLRYDFHDESFQSFFSCTMVHCTQLR